MPWVLFDNKIETDSFCSCLNTDHKRSENCVFLIAHDASMLSEHIRSFYEKKLIERLYNKNFCGLTHIENSNEILSFCQENAEKSKVLGKTLYGDVYHLLETRDRVIIRGAVDFSLLNYKKALHGVIEQGIEEYVVEYEKNSFLELLRYFVSIQTSTHRLVHVMAGFNATKVLDDQFEEICFYNFPGTYGDLISDFSTEEDRILSTLITVAPQRIILHDSANLFQMPFVQTLKSVFKGKVFVCRGCDNCKKALE